MAPAVCSGLWKRPLISWLPTPPAVDAAAAAIAAGGACRASLAVIAFVQVALQAWEGEREGRCDVW